MGDEKEGKVDAWSGVQVVLTLQPKLFMPYGMSSLVSRVLYVEPERYRVVRAELWAHAILAELMVPMGTNIDDCAALKSELEWKLTETIAELAGLRWPLEFACDPDDEPRRSDADEIIMTHSLTPWDRFKPKDSAEAAFAPKDETIH